VGTSITYGSAPAAGSNPVFRVIHDNAAKLMSFTDANSEKTIAGKKLTRVMSSAICEEAAVLGRSRERRQTS